MNPYLFPALKFGPLVLERAVRAVPEQRLHEPTHKDRFSVIEAVAHLVDWEPILLDRMKAAAENPGSTIVAYDEGQMAIDNNYANSNLNQQLDLFKARRAKTIEWLEALPSEKWSQHVIHPERGQLTLSDIANMMIGHDMYHIEQVSSVLADKTAGTW